MIGRCKRCWAVCGVPDTDPVTWAGTRLTVILGNGSQADITVCDACATVARDDEQGFLVEIEEAVVGMWVAENRNWANRYFKFVAPFLAVSHVVPWSVAGKGK